jgi:short-subunit dehydrogenase
MGLSAARQLAAKGANIIIISRNQQKLDVAVAEIKVGGVLAHRKCGRGTLTV